MKTALICIIGFATAFSLPLVEEPKHWEMIPTEDGHWHMVDVKEIEFQAQLTQRADFAVKFYLYTKSNPTSGREIVTGNAASLTGSNFSASRQTRVIIHGWNGDANSGPGVTIRQAYMNRGDFNVIVVDWGAGAKNSNYATARNNVPDAARKVADFLNFLNTHGTSFNNIYLVGHSLGAHVSGLAGKSTRAKPNTIFGLDAALPLFSGAGSTRLYTGDATYVESIHTDGGRLGFDQPIGNASFYPAWSGVQPGCGIDALGSCSHSRAIEYFAESVQASNGFLGKKCASYSEIQKKSCTGSATGRMGGEPSNHSVTGVYYVPVNSGYPFATGKV